MLTLATQYLRLRHGSVFAANTLEYVNHGSSSDITI